MQITKDDEFSSHVMSALLEDYKKTARAPDGKFHISELLQPRQAYFTRKYGREMTESDIKMFLSGTCFHEYVQKVLGNKFAEKRISLGEDIVGTIDFYDGDRLLEIKTSRKWSVPEYPEPHYVSQVTKYMAIEKKLTGIILVIYFTAGRTWKADKASVLEIMAWKVTVTPEEQEEDLRLLVATRALLINATETDNFEQLPLCYEFSCFSEYYDRIAKKKIISKVCPFYGICEPDNRYNEKAFEFWKKQNKDKINAI